MNLVRRILLATLFIAPVAAQNTTSDKDQTEIKNFHLDVDKLNRFTAASKSLMANQKAYRGLRDAMTNNEANRSIDGMVRLVGESPVVSAAIRDAGMTAREYSVMTATLVSCFMLAGMKKEGVLTEVPPTVSAENVAFIEQNYDRIESLIKSMHSDMQ